MKKNGFTLIELLAVIVILAIIALIATPIVLNIISDSKESSTLQSAEFYLGAVETAVVQKIIDEPAFKPTICDIQSDGNLKCDGIDVEVEIKGETPTSGTIILKNGKIKDVELLLSEKTIIKNSDGKLVYGEAKSKEKTLDDICEYDSTSGVAEKTAGAKYSCEVKEGTNYNFYVLTTPSEGDATINLILERNICEDGTLTDANKTDKCLVAWNTSGSNLNGPVTAMDFLYNATKDWENIPNIEMNYTDEGQTTSNGYGTIITEDNITKITKSDGSPITVLTDQEGYINLKARLPYNREIRTYQENKANLYLYEFLESCSECAEGYKNIQTNQIVGITGYWLFGSYQTLGPNSARYVYSYGGSFQTSVSNKHGVRPVITLKI